MYFIVLLPNINACTIRLIRYKNKLDLFIANWSYSCDFIFFATYQRIRVKGKSWAGLSNFLRCSLENTYIKVGSKTPIFCLNFRKWGNLVTDIWI